MVKISFIIQQIIQIRETIIVPSEPLFKFFKAKSTIHQYSVYIYLYRLNIPHPTQKNKKM